MLSRADSRLIHCTDESLWPVRTPSTATTPKSCASYKGQNAGCATQHTFENPNSPVHITTGNGGPPSQDSFTEDCYHGTEISCRAINSTRKQSLKYGYGRLIAYNASTMLYQQVDNDGGSIVDSFVITQTKHGPYPLTADVY